MKIKTWTIHPYEIPFKHFQRKGFLINLINEEGSCGWGDVAPLPKWSRETLNESLEQLNQAQHILMKMNWTADHCLTELANFNFFPSLSFALESAMLSILQPLPECMVPTSALLMGSPEEILELARVRHSEGYISAKLKIGHLNFEEAKVLIDQLKDTFRLRIDVNRAWTTEDSLEFFSQFPLDAFDYVEEPFQNPHDLVLFKHTLAVDESFPHDVSLEELETFPSLKALIYKPTIQGGMYNCLALEEWAAKHGISIVLSSSFESDIGLALIASIAHRLSLSAPIGIGTYHFMSEHYCKKTFRFECSKAYIPSSLNLIPCWG